MIDTIGALIIDRIIAGKLLHATCAHEPDHECIVVWSTGAVEQLDALVSEHSDQLVRKSAIIESFADAVHANQDHIEARADRAEASACEAVADNAQLRAEVERLKAADSFSKRELARGNEIIDGLRQERDQLRARVVELDTENCRLINKVDVQAVELYKLEQDKARLIAVVIPHIDDLRGTALALVRAGYASALKNTIAEIEKAADELRAAIDAARAGKGAT